MNLRVFFAAVLGVVMLVAPPRAFAQLMDGHHDTIPDLCASPTTVAVQNGNWSSPSTWSTGVVPGTNARVGIPAGRIVTYDVSSLSVVYCVGIHGALTFAPGVSTRLTVGTLYVYPDGALTLIPASPSIIAEIVLSGVLEQGTVGSPGPDVEGHGVGLLGFGAVSMRGAQKSPFVRLASEVAAAGTASLTAAAAPVGWLAGDELVVPDTRQFRLDGTAPFQQGANLSLQIERRTLATVAGTTLALSTPLTYAHVGARNRTGIVEYTPHVANLTRNVKIRSANPTGVRGHIFFTSQAAIDLQYVEIRGMGRTLINQLDCTLYTTNAFNSGASCGEGTGPLTHIGTNQKARYALHFHALRGPVNPSNTGYQATAIGNAIVDSTKWPVSLHDTNYVRFEDNVIAFGNGALVMLEDGHENFNLINHNFAIGSRSYTNASHPSLCSSGSCGGPREQAGREAVGFWGKGHSLNNYWTNNISTGHANMHQEIVTDVGFKYIVLDGMNLGKIPNFRGADLMVSGQYTLVDPRTKGMLQFEGNECYGVMGTCLTIWNSGTNGYNTVPNMPVSLIKNTVSWHLYEQAFFPYPMHNYTIDGWIHRGLASAIYHPWYPIGFYNGDYKIHTTTYRNIDVRGMMIGLQLGSGWDGPAVLENVSVQAHIGLKVESFFTPGTNATPLTNRTLSITNFTYTPVNAGTSNVSLFKSMFGAGANSHRTHPEAATVSNFQGVTGDNFRYYYTQQGSENVAGGVAPCSTTRATVVGIACPIGSPPVPAPATPASLRILP